jgi:hypothetical protein
MQIVAHVKTDLTAYIEGSFSVSVYHDVPQAARHPSPRATISDQGTPCPMSLIAFDQLG